MKYLSKIFLISVISISLTACNEKTEIVEVEKQVIVENTTTIIEQIKIPVIVPVPEGSAQNIEVGPRPYFLVEDMDDGELKTSLQQCNEGPFYKTDFSIGHRGAPMEFPEHTKESYEAAARMGAGIIECDVTFTADKELVCRHSQCDLHTTTNILDIPELAAKCSVPFVPADLASGTPAQAQCCTSDITLLEFKTLKGKMDAANSKATTVAQYLDGTPSYRTDMYASRGTLMTHTESIELFKKLNVKMTPELKSPSVAMPFDGFTQNQYAQKMLDEYKSAGVSPDKVFPQSFNISDVLYWIANEPEFAQQAVYLDGRYGEPTFDTTNPSTWSPSMEQLVADGVKIIAPPIWMLVAEGSEEGKIIQSVYALAAKNAGLNIIAWSLERAGPLAEGGGWYYQTINNIINNDGDKFKLLDVLAQDVGIIGMFSDWPGTTTYYASCKNLKPSI